MNSAQLHPIVARMAPSSEQEPAVLLRGRDVAVTAGAGTGKTRTLVARYLALLAEGVPLGGIVAITFTRKAAREMRNRVREAVRAYLETSGLTADERDLWQGIYTGLDAARIGTIHSLCTEILRHHPAEAGIDPLFEVLDEGQAALLQAQAVDETMAWAADDPLAVALFPLLGEAGLRRAARWILEQRLALEAAWETVPTEPETLLAHWEIELAAARGASWDALLADPGFAGAAGLLAQCHPLDSDDRMVAQRREVLEALSDSELPREALYAVLDGIRLNFGKQGAWAGGKAELAEVKLLMGTLRDLCRERASMLTLEINEADRVWGAHMPALRALADWVAGRYALHRAQRRALDFDDLEAGAVALLRDHPSVRAYWQGQVQALLVDEFQDTNARQRDLIELLNGDGGRLFVVGDGKQSIYRFRGADVTVFRELRQEIEARGACFHLQTSYRAHRHLIALFNEMLRPVLGPEEDPARPYIEPFAPLAPYRQNPIAGLRAPYLELHVALGAKNRGAMALAAQALANRLVALVERDGLDYGNIAILCRATSSFAAYEDALEAAGVPFMTVAGRGFYERPEVRDVLNALRAIDDPTDDLALAGLLRSPACGLSDAALYRLRVAQRAAEAESLWATLVTADLGFLENEETLAGVACALVEKLHTLAGRTPVADVLKALLDTTDYRAALLRAGLTRGARNLDKLLDDAYASQMASIGSFVEYVQQIRDVGAREGEARTLSEGAVQIMTVHAAKGLEFPVIVLGDIGWQGGARRSPLLDSDLGPLLPIQEDEAVGAAHVLAQTRAREREEAEERRLLYVAATRAEDLLILSGVPPSRKGGWWTALQEALGIAELLDAEGDEMVARQHTLHGQQVGLYIYPEACSLPQKQATQAEERHEPLPDALPLLAPLTAPQLSLDEESQAAGADPPRRVWRVVPVSARAAAPAWVVGQIVHEALALWRFPAEGPGQSFRAWAEAQAAGYGIAAEAERRDAARRAARMLTRFRETPLYRQIAGAERRLHEVPYSLATEQGWERGIVDLLYQMQGKWTLVEFKTDDIRSEAALAERLEHEDYRAQIRRYQDAVDHLLSARSRALLCLLNYAGTVRWMEV